MITITCDGCGLQIEGDVHEQGIVDKVQYCESCNAAYLEHRKRVDEEHDKACAAWRETCRDLTNNVGMKLPDF